MQAYIDSICSRSPPSTAAAVRPTKSALLLQSRQLERKRQLDERAAHDQALQAGKGASLWGLPFSKQRSDSRSRVRPAQPRPHRLLHSAASSFFASSTSRTQRNASPPASAASLRRGSNTGPQRTPRPLGLPPTSPSQRQQQQHNQIRMWTPFSSVPLSGQRTPGREQRLPQEGARSSARDPLNDSSSLLKSSPWHPLFTHSPSPAASPSAPQRPGRFSEDVGEEAGEHRDVVGAAAPQVFDSAPFYARLSRADEIQSRSPVEENNQRTHAPTAQIRRSRWSAATMSAEANVPISSPSHSPLPPSPPRAAWAAWEPPKEKQQLSNMQRQTGSASRLLHAALGSSGSGSASVLKTSATHPSPPHTRANAVYPSFGRFVSAVPSGVSASPQFEASTSPSLHHTLRGLHADLRRQTEPQATPSPSRRALRDDENFSINTSRFPGSSSHVLSEPSHFVRQSSASHPPSLPHHRRHHTRGAPCSLRDLHELLLHRLEAQSRVAAAAAAQTARPHTNAAHSSTTTDAVLTDTRATVQLWRATREVCRRLAEQRDLMHSSSLGDGERRDTFDGAARGTRNFRNGGEGQRQDQKRRTAASTRAYLYGSDAEGGTRATS
ncbi:hypothetical protein ABB37_06144 [Leptomonas pyrrhocoris]|uniref:Uncharacterized protein n=1 Tax=Leptomonas pyrrhocoris TaxID=157538 RepID=A0A0M9FYG0_LEPPY|nr:hypothetical protein ABB37_06144 [Leptomonas pyrrhocoris]KPA78543.1 hypothetical protein ABB37_06144 [Leptomonas pyrrhocoris]|eukprot:XP_015656982.1 hypothetical protein ABB37_06144 [Leptomonas pyrrhocoris]